MATSRTRPKNSRLLSLARKMRQQPTRAENILWQALRNCNPDGYKFKRQNPIGQYIVDFSCDEVKLIVELDGGVHVDHEQEDELRTMKLEILGYRVVRFMNEDVLLRLDAVTHEIWLICEERRQKGTS